jgi:hypothetical protein
MKIQKSSKVVLSTDDKCLYLQFATQARDSEFVIFLILMDIKTTEFFVPCKPNIYPLNNFFMNHLLIDLNALLQDPKVICYTHEDYTLWVSAHCLDEEFLQKIGVTARKTLHLFLKAAEKQKSIRIIPVKENIEPGIFPVRSINYSVNFVDFSPVLDQQYNELSVNQNDTVVYVTQSSHYSKRMKVKKAIHTLKKSGATYNKKLANMSTNISDEKFTRYLSYLLLALLVAGIVLHQELASFLTGNIYLSLSLALGIPFIIWALYKLRSKRRFLYGMLELFIGIIVIIQVIVYSHANELGQLDYIKIISSIYIVIRGLSNIEDALEKSDNLYYLEKWRKIF